MPIVNYICPHCNTKSQKLLKSEQIKTVMYCPHDNTSLLREYGNPSTISKEIIDNNLMARPVERFTDSAELIEEREYNSDLQKVHKKL